MSLGPAPARRDALTRRIRLLVAATITYNVIEVSSATAVAWQFSARVHAVREAREQRTLRIIAVSFFALAAYVTVDAVGALVGTGEAEGSVPGLVIAVIAVKEGRDAWQGKGCCGATVATVPSVQAPADECVCRPGCDCCG